MFLVTGFIILSVIVTGAMLEQKKWIFHLEFLRIGIVGYLIFSLFSNPLLLFTIGMLGIVGLLFYQTIHSKYQEYLFSA